MPESKYDRSDWDETSANQSDDNMKRFDDIGTSGSDLDREVERFDVNSGRREMVNNSNNLHSITTAKHVSDGKDASRGALKLKSSKMRTSPPPPSKVDASLLDELSNHGSELEVKGHHRGNSWGGDEPETWAEGAEDDQWNSSSWQDMVDDNTSSSPGHSRKEPSPKHSVHSHNSNSISTVSKSGSATSKSNSHESETSKTNSHDSPASQKPTKPKVADLDIMSLDIKSSSVKAETGGEFDFFADMQPEIKVDSKGLCGVLDDNKTPGHKRASGTSPKKPTAVSFAINEGSEMEVNINRVRDRFIINWFIMHPKGSII